MKRVYHINDKQGLERMLQNKGLSKDEINNMLDSAKDFNVIYTLEGEQHSGTLNYELINGDTKEKININSLNGYEYNFLDLCFNHFHSGKDDELKENFIEVIN